MVHIAWHCLNLASCQMGCRDLLSIADACIGACCLASQVESDGGDASWLIYAHARSQVQATENSGLLGLQLLQNSNTAAEAQARACTCLNFCRFDDLDSPLVTRYLSERRKRPVKRRRRRRRPSPSSPRPQYFPKNVWDV